VKINPKGTTKTKQINQREVCHERSDIADSS